MVGCYVLGGLCMSFDLVRDGLSELGFKRNEVALWCDEVIVPEDEDFALMGGEYIDIEDVFGEVYCYLFEQQPEGNIVFKAVYNSEDYDDNYFPQ